MRRVAGGSDAGAPDRERRRRRVEHRGERARQPPRSVRGWTRSLASGPVPPVALPSTRQPASAMAAQRAKRVPRVRDRPRHRHPPDAAAGPRPDPAHLGGHEPGHQAPHRDQRSLLRLVFPDRSAVVLGRQLLRKLVHERLMSVIRSINQFIQPRHPLTDCRTILIFFFKLFRMLTYRRARWLN